MKSSLRITLNASPEQAERLKALQSAFAEVCNELAPLVRSTRCWNRVTLHHLAYKQLREKFPQMGSQMVCNAIYSVSRTARILFQNPVSPFHLSRLQGRELPSIRFADTSPVYFDRHTLSLKDGTASMYTLDGRMRFLLALSAAEEKNFHERKLREIVLAQNPAGNFQLTFWFVKEDEEDDAATKARAGSSRHKGTIPDYVKVEASA